MSGSLRRPVPNICEATGLSHDFRLAYRNLTHYLERVADGEPARTRFLAARSFLHRPVPRYGEHFDAGQFDNVVTPGNQAAVAHVDALIDRLNALREKAVIDYDTLAAIRAELDAAISGTTPVSR